MKIQTLFSLSALGLLVPLATITPAFGCTPLAETTPSIALADDKPAPPATDAPPAPVTPDAPATPDAPTTPAAMSDKIIVKADKGKTIEIKVGQRLLVRLPANPTTGYEWSAANLDAKVLAPDEETIFDVPETPLAGAPTVQTLFFKAKSAGKLKLELQYTRPWEKDVEPIDIYKVNVVIISK